MKIFSSAQIKQIDAYTIENEPVASVDLMERAANELFVWISKRFKKKTQFLFLIGPGNNGGDGWALARILFHYGYENIRLYLLDISDKLSPDSEINRTRLMEETDIKIKKVQSEDGFPYISEDDVVIDALFGTGLSRPLEGASAKLVDYLNNSPKRRVISVDIPSGLWGEDNSTNTQGKIVQADITLCFEFPKLSFFFSENEQYVGKWHVLPIGLHKEIIHAEFSPYKYLKRSDIKELIKIRSKFSHKGTYGHGLIIAGSYGMMGAAVLASRAAIRSGAGLVSVHIPRLGYEIMQMSVPEALVSIDESDLIFTGLNYIDKYSAIAIGPGINTKTNTSRAVNKLLEKAKIPLVIDADGLNILSEQKEWLAKLPENTILTPHPKEFDRLTHNHDTHYARFVTQQEFSKKNKVVVVLKGAHTSISTPDGDVWFNTTGNPGMAKGGSGDVLTGIILALLSQGYGPVEAARIGVYIHGLAGDIALKTYGLHALTPSDIICKLGRAFKKIEQN